MVTLLDYDGDTIGVTLHNFMGHLFFLAVVSTLTVDNDVTPNGLYAAFIIVIIVAHICAK